MHHGLRYVLRASTCIALRLCRGRPLVDDTLLRSRHANVIIGEPDKGSAVLDLTDRAVVVVLDKYGRFQLLAG